MLLLADLYSSVPGPLQDLACSLEGWRVRRDRYSARFHSLLRQVEERARWDEDRLMELRNQRLRTTLAWAASHSPFYGERFRSAGFDPAAIRDIDDLRGLPVLSKSEVKDHDSTIRTDWRPASGLRDVHTSGTTGGGLHFVASADALREQWAVWWRYRRWHGIDLDTWCGYFGGRPVVSPAQVRPPFWRFNHPGRQILFSTYHLAPENLRFYVDALRQHRPPWLHGYPSVLSVLAAYVWERRIDIGYQVRWVTTGAENLLPHQRKLMERAFEVGPRQHYGMAEAVANFSECEFGRLHVDEDFACVEFLPAGNGSSCRIVGGNFSNPAFPLIRYDSGDLAQPASQKSCPCGRAGRLVAEVDGREEDYILLRNGVRVGRMDHVFKDLSNIREAQIYQRKVGEIEIRVVRSDAYGPADEERLLAEFRSRVGDHTDIRIHYVDHLDRTPSGKLRFVVSELSEAKLAASKGRSSAGDD